MAQNYIVYFSPRFQKAFDKLTEEEQDLVMDKIRLLEDDPFYPSLRSKKVKGKPGYFEFSVNKDIRVIWHYENGRVIILFRIGHHDIIDEFSKNKLPKR